MKLPYKLNHEDKTIALTRKFAKESSVPGSDEYILLMKLKTDFPTYDITMRNIDIKKKAALAAAAATAVGIAPPACAGLTSATSATMASFSSFAAHGGMSQPALTESFHSFVSQTVETGTLPKFNSSEPRGMQIIFR